jgi:hypothetical protein
MERCRTAREARTDYDYLSMEIAIELSGDRRRRGGGFP